MSELDNNKKEIELQIKIQTYVDRINKKIKEVESALRNLSKESQIRVFLNTVVYPIDNDDFKYKNFTEKKVGDELVQILKLKEELAVFIKENGLVKTNERQQKE